MKQALHAALTVVIAVAGTLLAAEAALRLLPVADGPWAVPVNAAQPVFRFEPGQPFTYSQGPLLQLANAGRTNNAGFVSDQDYAANDPRPLLAVIGDSQVAAPMVPNRATFHRRLAAALPGLRVYNFAAPGAALSQYLVWARHAAQTYRPTALAIVVVRNDVDESLARAGRKPGLHVYDETGDGLALRRTDYAPSAAGRVLRRSALLRYLILNADMPGALRRALAIATAQASDQRRDDADRVMRAFLRDLPAYAGLPPDRIALVLDRVTAGDYAFRSARTRLAAAARAAGYAVLDLDPVFATDGTRLNFAGDGHWNAAGHAAVARALMPWIERHAVTGPDRTARPLAHPAD